MIKNLKTSRGKQLLSSILLVGVIYLLSPTSVSYDKLSANRLLTWLFALQLFIFFGVAITISFVLRVLRVKYSQKVCSFIFSLCLNDMLILTMLFTAAHIIFMLTIVNTIGSSYRWVVKGINFDIMLSVADMVIVIAYFWVLYKNSYPVNFLNALLKALKRAVKENNKEDINEKLLILKHFIQNYPYHFNKSLLEPILASYKTIKILSEIKNENGYLREIVDLLISLYFHLLNSHELKSAYKIFEIILEYGSISQLKRKISFLTYEGIEKRKIFYLIKCFERGRRKNYFYPKLKVFKKYLITIGFCRPNKEWFKKVMYKHHPQKEN
ncbi:hypothetical protein Calow_0796 [Caldicellulosiruptor owensensis OL]|uniref:Uncharacterized protein n=1 Tax=Caldicellulosiruptor owensensis (strain ATCC 700167 / DSM 13100 / OL) TaxID=632518 RepID=E4Q5Z2_CALOW|nr:hypothetical protein [Caldicellulosiruptor owensensis]ADQ04366.1 hypothetical protein Calow_0796 [Caldicellulosiruptor owensensis OL]